MLFNYSCMPFLPFPPPHPSWTYLPPPPPPSPPRFCPCVLYNSSCNPLFPLSPPQSPLATARLFPTSMSLVVFCLLFSSIDYVPVKGEGKEKERETSMGGCLSHAPYWGSGWQPRPVPWLRQALVHRSVLNPLSYTSQGRVK